MHYLITYIHAPHRSPMVKTYLCKTTWSMVHSTKQRNILKLIPIIFWHFKFFYKFVLMYKNLTMLGNYRWNKINLPLYKEGLILKSTWKLGWKWLQKLMTAQLIGHHSSFTKHNQFDQSIRMFSRGSVQRSPRLCD